MDTINGSSAHAFLDPVAQQLGIFSVFRAIVPVCQPSRKSETVPAIKHKQAVQRQSMSDESMSVSHFSIHGSRWYAADKTVLMPDDARSSRCLPRYASKRFLQLLEEIVPMVLPLRHHC